LVCPKKCNPSRRAHGVSLQSRPNRRRWNVKRIILASVTAAILTLILGMLVIALLAPAAHAEDGVRYPGESRQERSLPERPHYLPSYERTQRRYLPRPVRARASQALR